MQGARVTNAHHKEHKESSLTIETDSLGQV